MLETILWVIGGLIALSILFFLLKIFLIVMGVKKVIEAVKEEVDELPKDYQNVRKTVENENASVGSRVSGTAKTAAKVGWRWFKKL